MGLFDRVSRKISEEQRYLKNMDNLRKGMPERAYIIDIYPTQALAIAAREKLKRAHPSVHYRIQRSATGKGFILWTPGK